MNQFISVCLQWWNLPQGKVRQDKTRSIEKQLLFANKTNEKQIKFR